MGPAEPPSELLTRTVPVGEVNAVPVMTRLSVPLLVPVFTIFRVDDSNWVRDEV
jgi:hypothetical protein